MKVNWSKNVKFHPWIGKNYEESEKKILVLGESHYDWIADGEKYYSEGCEFTKGYIKGLIKPDTRSGYGNKGTWTKFEKAFLGETEKKYNESTIAKFWNSVAFYNFVQFSVEDGSRVKPSSESFENSIQPFFEVLEKLNPNIIIVLGHRLWNYLPSKIKGKPFKIDYYPIENCVFEYENGKSYAFRVYHPSSGFTPSYWNKVIKKGLSFNV